MMHPIFAQALAPWTPPANLTEQEKIMTHYDKTRVTFHSGNAFQVDGMEVEPFATFTCDIIVDSKLIDSICALVREHIHTANGEFCNIKVSTEDWDC